MSKYKIAELEAEIGMNEMILIDYPDWIGFKNYNEKLKERLAQLIKNK